MGKFKDFIGDDADTAIYNSYKRNEKTFTYKSDSVGTVKISYVQNKKTLYFKFINKDKKEVIIMTKMDKYDRDPEVTIFNYLKEMDY